MSAVRWPRGPLLALCRRILAAGAGRVPPPRRAGWLAEWEGELFALHGAGAPRGVLLRYALDGYAAGLWEKRQEEGFMGGFGQDLRHAWRRLSRTPLATGVIVLVLALGIGANTALLSALRAALLERSPYPAADRLVVADLLLQTRADAPLDTIAWSYPKFQLARRSLTRLEDLAAYAPRTATLTGAGDAVRIGIEYVTPSYFDVLGVRALRGRTFGAADEYPSSAPGVLLGHALWLARFGGADVIGRLLQIDGTALPVVGVLPPGFRGVSGSADVMLPVAALATIRGARRVENAWSHWLYGLGRLRPGATLEQARMEATTIAAAITRTWPDPSGGGAHGVALVPFLRARVNPVARLAITAVSAGGLLLLLIACANVAGLLLAKTAAQRADTAVRAALGAGRARLVRESLLESLMLALAGGGGGLLLALAGQRLVLRAVTGALETRGARDLQYLSPDALALDWIILLAGIGLALLTGLLFGLLPARTASRPDLSGDLRSGPRAFTPGRDGLRTGRGLLVAGQLALTLILLAGAGLAGASFARLSALDTGFTHDQVLTLRYERGAGPRPADDRVFEDQLLERLAALPGAVSAAIAPCPPLTGMCEVAGLRQIDDGAKADFGDMPSIMAYEVTDTYFATLGIQLREGRLFGPTDVSGGQPVALINAAAARKWFAAGSAIGHRLAVTHELTSERPADIIGVVDDVRYAQLEEEAIPAVYFSRRQAPSSYGTIFVRAGTDPLSLLDNVRRTVAQLAPELPLFDVSTMAQRKAAATARTRVVLGLLAAFALTGLLLAVVGLYGVVAYAVAQRTRELGLRLALGAARRDVLGLVLTPPALLALGGIAAGAGGALLLTRFVRALLYGIEPGDPRVLSAATLLLVAVALIAAWVPARRATRVDPAMALKSD